MLGFRKRKTATGRQSTQSFTNYRLKRIRADGDHNALCVVLEDDDGAEYIIILDGDAELNLLRNATEQVCDTDTAAIFNMPRTSPDVTVS